MDQEEEHKFIIAQNASDAHQKAGRSYDPDGWIHGFNHGLVFAKQIIDKNGLEHFRRYVDPLLK